MYPPFCMNICHWESCVQSGYRVCSQSIKNDNASTIQGVVCNCFNVRKRSFCVNIRQWMKLGSTTSHPESNRQSAEWTAVGKSRPKRPKNANISREGFRSPYFGKRKVFSSVDYLEKGRIINSEYYRTLLVRFERRSRQKTAIKVCSFTKTMHCVTSQSQMMAKLHELHFELLLHHSILHIWPPATTGCFQTSKECSRERYLAPMNKGYRKLSCILRQKQIVLQKRHLIVREALKLVYQPRRRLCQWIMSNFP